MGPEAERVFAQLQFAQPGDATVYSEVKSKLDAYFTPKKNLIHERCVFNQRGQLAGENIETYAA